MEKAKKALVLFSGGKDSLLVTLRLLDEGYKVYLVTFENGCGLKANNVNNTRKRLIHKYGDEKIENIGIKNISGLFREFIYPFYNYTSSYIKEKFKELIIIDIVLMGESLLYLLLIGNRGIEINAGVIIVLNIIYLVMLLINIRSIKDYEIATILKDDKDN